MTGFESFQAGFMLGWVARLAMAAIFALAALESLRDWAAYAAITVNYRVLPRNMAIVAACLLPALELLAALLLLAGVPAGALLGLGLMWVFTAAVAINVWRGRTDIDCGCGGAAGQMLSWSLVVRNALLAVLLAGAAAAPRVGRLDSAALICIAGSALFLVTTYFSANQLLANRQRLGAA
jgi:hypothetical protein